MIIILPIKPSCDYFAVGSDDEAEVVDIVVSRPDQKLYERLTPGTGGYFDEFCGC